MPIIICSEDFVVRNKVHYLVYLCRVFLSHNYFGIGGFIYHAQIESNIFGPHVNSHVIIIPLASLAG